MLGKKKRYVELLKASKLEKKPLDLINNDRIIIDSSIQKLENCCKLLLEKTKQNVAVYVHDWMH